jgi:CBS domain-containing protein
VAFPDEYLESVIDRMMQANIAHLPVVSRGDEELQGYLSWKDLLRVRIRLQAEERQRARLYRRARPQADAPTPERRGLSALNKGAGQTET